MTDFALGEAFLLSDPALFNSQMQVYISNIEQPGKCIESAPPARNCGYVIEQGDWGKVSPGRLWIWGTWRFWRYWAGILISWRTKRRKCLLSCLHTLIQGFVWLQLLCWINCHVQTSDHSFWNFFVNVSPFSCTMYLGCTFEWNWLCIKNIETWLFACSPTLTFVGNEI